MSEEERNKLLNKLLRVKVSECLVMSNSYLPLASLDKEEKVLTNKRIQNLQKAN